MCIEIFLDVVCDVFLLLFYVVCLVFGVCVVHKGIHRNCLCFVVLEISFDDKMLMCFACVYVWKDC